MKKRLLVLGMAAVLAALTGCGKKIALKENAQVSIELGQEPEEVSLNPSDYLEIPEGAEVTLSMEKVNTQEAGTYVITAVFGKQSVEIPAIVADTTAPQVTLREGVEAAVGTELKPEDCLAEIQDFSEYSLKFSLEGEEADTYKVEAEGEQEYILTATDSHGNAQEYRGKVTGYTPDTTAPTITARDRSFTVGYDLDYMKWVEAVDETDGDLTASVTVDHSGVDKDTPGTYKAVYTVTDAAGNTATKEVTVTVTAKKAKTTPQTQPGVPGTPEQPAGSAASGGSGSASGSAVPEGGGSASGNAASDGSPAGTGSSSSTTGTSSGDSGSSGGDSGEDIPSWVEPPSYFPTPEEIEDAFNSYP